MSRTYRRNKKSYLDKKITEDAYGVNDNAKVRVAKEGKEINEDEYLVRNLVFRGGVRKKYIHPKKGWSYSPFSYFNGTCYREEVYDTLSAFWEFKEIPNFSVPKSFRKVLEVSYRAKAKQAIEKWKKNPEDSDVLIDPITRVSNAKWLYY